MIQEITHLKVVDKTGAVTALLSACGTEPCPYKGLGTWTSPCQEICTDRRKYVFRVIGTNSPAGGRVYKPGKCHSTCQTMYNQENWLPKRSGDRIVPVTKEECTILLLGMKNLWRKKS